MKLFFIRAVERILSLFRAQTKELILAFLFIAACSSSWALLPSVGVSGYSNFPPVLWLYVPHLERATPELLCTDAIAKEALGTSSSGKAIFSSVVSGPSEQPFCTVMIRDCGPNGASSCTVYLGRASAMYQVRQCPANSLDAVDHCQCKSGFQDDASQTACEPIPPPEPDDNMCKAGALVGNPILPATAEKYRAEEDFADSGPSPLNFGRYYRSSWANDASRTSIGLGAGWTHNHAFGLKASPALAPTSIAVTSPEGYVRKFVRPAGTTIWTAIGSADRMSTGVDGTWVYMRADDDATLTFNAAGNLLTQAARNGWVTRYAYDAAGRLASITNPFDRTLRLTYDAGGRLVSVTGSGARTVSYGYDASGRLYTVGYTDGRRRTLLYENTSFPNVLTGLLDEAGTRFGTFAYDSSGRAISTELAGAAERYSLMYAAGMAIVTDPIGMVRVFKYGTSAGKLTVTSNSRPSGTGSPSDDAASRTQDANGLVTSETDFKGIVTTTAWDVSRRLPVTVVRAAGTAEAQTVTTQWHANFALPVLVTEAGRTTSFTYDAHL